MNLVLLKERDESGSSLIQVMVFATLLALMAFAIADLMGQSNRNSLRVIRRGQNFGTGMDMTLISMDRDYFLQSSVAPASDSGGPILYQ